MERSMATAVCFCKMRRDCRPYVYLRRSISSIWHPPANAGEAHGDISGTGALASVCARRAFTLALFAFLLASSIALLAFLFAFLRAFSLALLLALFWLFLGTAVAAAVLFIVSTSCRPCPFGWRLVICGCCTLFGSRGARASLLLLLLLFLILHFTQKQSPKLVGMQRKQSHSTPHAFPYRLTSQQCPVFAYFSNFHFGSKK